MAGGSTKTRQRTKASRASAATIEQTPIKPPVKESVADTLPSERARLFYAAVLFIVSLSLYSLTLAPTVTLVDSGELITASRTLGVAHPPGFPLYVLLAHLAALVPIGNVAARVNFASAVFGAGAAAMLTLAVAEAMISAAYLSRLRRQAQKKAARRSNRKIPSRDVGLETDQGSITSPWIVLAHPACRFQTKTCEASLCLGSAVGAHRCGGGVLRQLALQ